MATFSSEIFFSKNNQKIIFRNFEPSDAEQYSSFSETIARETTHTLHYSGQIKVVSAMKEKWANAIDSPWQLELGGFDENKLISHLSFYKPRPYHPFEQHTLEFSIKILKAYCFNGLGSKKILIMEDVAKKMDIKRIQGKVRTSNYIGINFYKKHGYEIEGIKKHAAFINGVYENEFYIAKIFN